MERIWICDSTLRDGEQSPDAGMTFDQKIQLGEKLIDLGVDILEAGFARTSTMDADVIYRLAQTAQNKDVVISSIARCCQEDIDIAVKALEPAIACKKGHLHLFTPTSFIHSMNKLHKTPEGILHLIRESIQYAKKIAPVKWSAEDATRSNKDFLVQCIQAAVDAGANTINLADTVGQMVDTQMQQLFEYVIQRVKYSSDVVFSVHCHNDKGLATANTLFAIKGGARQVDCCMNGLGERAGNAALEEIVMAIKTTPEIYPFTTRIDTKKIMEVSQMVEKFSGFQVSKNKAIIGKNAFAHASGVHQNGVIRGRAANIKTMYSAISPELLGREDEIVITRHSGSCAIEYVLNQEGISISPEMARVLLQTIKEQENHPKSFSRQELVELYQRVSKTKKSA